MTDDIKRAERPPRDGYGQRGHAPRKVQGGYVPTAGSVTKPPSGGSGAKLPKK